MKPSQQDGISLGDQTNVLLSAAPSLLSVSSRASPLCKL